MTQSGRQKRHYPFQAAASVFMEVRMPGGADWDAERLGENEAEGAGVARPGDMNDVGGEGAEAALDRVPVAVKENIVPETPVTGKAA